MKKNIHTQGYQLYDIHFKLSNLNLPQASELLSLLPIQGVSYTSRKQLPIQGSQASRKIPLLSNLDHKDPSQAPLAQLFGV